MRKIALIGGDCRQIHAATELKKAGFSPFFYGNDPAAGQGFTAPYTLQETLQDAEALLLPVPTFQNQGCVPSPLFEKSILLSSVAKFLPEACTVFVWGRDKSEIFVKNRTIDLSKNETLVAQNARATAEAALSLAMKHSQKAFFKTRCVIVGYGRIGSHLASHLLSLGAEVRVGARRKESRKSAQVAGCDVFSIEDVRLFAGADLVFNTVPEPILSKKLLELLPKEAIYIELASAPGGLSYKDPPFAVVPAPSLPGRFCPKSAGQFLAQAVLSHLLSEKETFPW